MKFPAAFFIIGAFISTTLATEATENKGASGHFSAIAIRSGSPIHQVALSVKNLGLIVSSDKPTTYCPTIQVKQCPPGNETIFSAGSSGYLGMDTEVPGGQGVYVTKEGRVMITQAHSGAMPAGAIQTGFSYQPAAQKGHVGILHFNGARATGFVACKTTDPRVYDIYANIHGAQVSSHCLGMDVGTVPYTYENANTWQYT